MENGPSTPAPSPPIEVNDLGGPGLFSTGKKGRTQKSTMGEQSDSDQSSEKHSMEHESIEQTQSADGNSSDSSHNQRSEGTSTPAAINKSQHLNQPSSAAHTMAPPPVPKFHATPTPTSAQPPRAAEPESSQDPATPFADETRGGGSRIPTSTKQEKRNTRPTNGKRRREELDQKQTKDDEAVTDAFNDPSIPLAAFDWEGLEQRYHHQMSDYRQQELEIYRSFEELCQYFAIWAQKGHDHEVERSFKRQRTQATLVRHHEEQLEAKRQHYVKVVDAFKSALQLLGGGNY